MPAKLRMLQLFIWTALVQVRVFSMFNVRLFCTKVVVTLRPINFSYGMKRQHLYTEVNTNPNKSQYVCTYSSIAHGATNGACILSITTASHYFSKPRYAQGVDLRRWDINVCCCFCFRFVHRWDWRFGYRQTDLRPWFMWRYFWSMMKPIYQRYKHCCTMYLIQPIHSLVDTGRKRILWLCCTQDRLIWTVHLLLWLNTETWSRPTHQQKKTCANDKQSHCLSAQHHNRPSIIIQSTNYHHFMYVLPTLIYWRCYFLREQTWIRKPIPITYFSKLWILRGDIRCDFLVNGMCLKPV